MKNKKTGRLWIVGGVIVAIVLISFGLWLYLDRDSDAGDKETDRIEAQSGNAGETPDQDSGEPISNVEAETETPPELVMPGEGKLNIAEIQGFEKAEQTVKLEDTNLTIEAIGSYSGTFLEDGSDEAIEKGLALIVTNNNAKTLQIAMLSLTDGDKTYEFQITTLPAGASVLVLEKNKAIYDSALTYRAADCSTGYFSETTLLEKELRLTPADGKIKVENIGQKNYSKMYIYYKLIKRGGVYMGGITYRTPVEDLKAGETQEVVAGHYREATGQIMMVEAAES